MYRYTDSDRGFIRARAAQFRDQLQRHLAGEIGRARHIALLPFVSD